MKHSRHRNRTLTQAMGATAGLSGSAISHLHATRRGSSLVQAVITITVMGVMMTVVANVLFRMYHQESLMVERTFQTSTWLQLSRVFREDIHAALMIKQSEDGSRLELVTTDGPVTWVANGEKIRRTTQAGEMDDAADSSAIDKLPGEQYVFADSVAQLCLSVGTAGASSVATVEVTPLPTPKGRNISPNVTVATAGLDHRFLASVAMPEEQP